MKFHKILLCLSICMLTLITSVHQAHSQATVLGNPYTKKTSLFRGGLVSDSTFRVPYRDTTFPSWLSSTYKKGAIVCRPADSLLYTWDGGKWAQLTPRQSMHASAALNFPSMATLTSADLTIVVTGAAVGDVVLLGPPAAPEAKLGYTAFVSATDTVTVRALNVNASTLDPASATFNVIVTKQ